MTEESHTETNTTTEQSGIKACGRDGEEVRHFVRTLNLFDRFLLFMSKTEMKILLNCTRSTRMTLSSIGGMVVITGVLAFFSAFFTIKSCFFGSSAKYVQAQWFG